MECDEIIKDIAERTNLSFEDAESAVQIFIDIVTDELKNDGKVSLSLNDGEYYEIG